MGSKLLFLALIALLSIHGFEAKHPDVIEDTTATRDRDLVDDFVKLIGEIRQNIITAISKGASKINDLLQDVIKMGKVKIDEAITEMEKIEQTIKEEIQKLAEKAEETGELVDKCVLASDIQLSSLMLKSVDNMEQCFEGPRQIAKKMHEDIQVVMDKNSEVIDNLLEEFRKCDGLQCRVQVITKGTEEMNQAYQKVQKIIDSAVMDVSTALPNVLKCVRDAMDDFEEKIVGIVKDFKSCIGVDSTFDINARSMSGQFDKMMKDIMQSIYNSVKNALGQISIVGEDMREEAKEIIEASLVEVDELIDEVLEEVKGLMSASKDAGENVAKCVLDQSQRWEKLVLDTRNNIESCLESAVDIIEDSRAEAEGVINETIEQINALAEDFNNCDEMECRVETVKKAYSVLKQGQDSISKIVQETIKDIRDVLPEAKNCVEQEKVNLLEEVNKIISDIRKCINDSNGGTLFEYLKQIVQEAQEKARKVIAENLNNLQKEMEKLKTIVFESSVAVHEEIKEMSSEIFRELSKLKDETKEMGEHVKFCVNYHQSKMIDLVKQTEENIEECLKGLNEILNELYEGVEKAMNEGYDKIFDLVGQFYDCPNLSCKSAVLKQGIQAMFEFNERVTDAVAKATNSMREAIPEAIECVSNQSKNFKLAAREIMDEVSKCIDQDL